MYNKCPRVIRDYLRQSGQIIICGNFLKMIQVNRILNMESVEEDSKNNLTYRGCNFQIFTHSIDLYEGYNTYAVITQIQGLLKQNLRNLESLGKEKENGAINE